VIGNAAKSIPKKDGGPAGALLVTEHDGKVAAVCALNGAAVEAGFDAVAILRGVGGRGGGRPHTAQGTIPGDLSLDGLRAAATKTLASGS